MQIYKLFSVLRYLMIKITSSYPYRSRSQKTHFHNEARLIDISSEEKSRLSLEQTICVLLKSTTAHFL